MAIKPRSRRIALLLRPACTFGVPLLLKHAWQAVHNDIQEAADQQAQHATHEGSHNKIEVETHRSKNKVLVKRKALGM